ncbi:hypothetical protein NE454_15825 [Blautia producta]|uniref:hypothetical protein n=1 Tax=Blautia producta TaxID=33035 RepID=UPI00210B98FE|nr:hypothetical protein [Blautia producta]MCQ5125872.1 hypothetical protein [Blautia producta]
MKEMFIILRMALALYKEIDIRAKLLKHRHKMLDIYIKYQDHPFEYEQTKKWRDDLKTALCKASEEMRDWR